MSKGVDRISELPDDLIIHILSLLPTNEDRIRTETLSTRWKNLWTCVPSLSFSWDVKCPDGFNFWYECEEEVQESLRHFGKRVGKILDRIRTCSSGTKVREFRVKCPNKCVYVDAWVWFATTNETEDFELDTQPFNGCIYCPYTLPEHLYTNSHFRELRFNLCEFSIREPISWGSLKKLTVTNSDTFDKGALEKIVAGAPALEFLDLKHCGISKLHRGNSVLKKLNLHTEVDKIEISAPSVESLHVSGRFQTCKLVDMASLVEATLYNRKKRDSNYPILTREVISVLLNAHTLTVSTWVIQGIAMLPTSDVCSLFPKCKSLTVDTDFWKQDPSGIASLLKRTPQVETLIVTMSKFDNKDKFLLKNVRGLQKVIIDFVREGYGIENTSTEVFETSQKLLSFPKSADAKIMILPLRRKY